jgi:hypothetical protein
MKGRDDIGQGPGDAKTERRGHRAIAGRQRSRNNCSIV